MSFMVEKRHQSGPTIEERSKIIPVFNVLVPFRLLKINHYVLPFTSQIKIRLPEFNNKYPSVLGLLLCPCGIKHSL